METLDFSISEGKRHFSEIIRASEQKKQGAIIRRRGNPVAIILPYEDYMKGRKVEALRRIREARSLYGHLEITADQVYETSRGMLEGYK
ncbi:MAG: type II toxin-antitoxin system Phd/YefM family antitoxin [Pseudomonadota bacterium]